MLSFPEAGVEVYRVPTGAGALASPSARTALRGAPDVRFAGRAWSTPTSGEPVVYTENLFVKFADDADPEACRPCCARPG